MVVLLVHDYIPVYYGLAPLLGMYSLIACEKRSNEACVGSGLLMNGSLEQQSEMLIWQRLLLIG